MSDLPPPSHQPPPPQQPQTSTGMQVLGFVIGVVLGFIVAFFVLTSLSRTPWLAWAVVATCLGLSIAVLVVRSLRTAGAGLLAGMAIGVISLAGVCGGLIGVLATRG